MSVLFLGLSIWIYFSLLLDDLFLLLTFLTIGVTSFYLDFRRMRIGRNKFISQKFWYRTTRYLGIFIGSGYLAGLFAIYFVKFFAAQIPSYAILPSSTEYLTSPLISESLTLTIIFVGIITGLSFYRVLVENNSLGLHTQQLFSGEHEVGFLLQFFLMSSYVAPILLTIAYGNSENPRFSSTFIAASRGLINYVFFFTTILIIVVMGVVYLARFLIKHSRYAMPPSSSRSRFVGISAGVVILVYSLIQLFRLYNFQSFVVFISSALLEGLVVILFHSGLNGELCAKCHLLKIKAGESLVCNSCDLEKGSIVLPNLLSTKVMAPKCPNCATPWNSLSRQCSSCNYLILLSCPFCSQTINPLWQICINCENNLVPIPNLALETGSSRGFARSTVVSFLFGSIILLNFIFELTAVINIYGLNADDRKNFYWYLYGSVIRVIVFGVALLALVGLILRFNSGYFMPVLLLVSRPAFWMMTTMMLYAVLYLPLRIYYVTYSFFPFILFVLLFILSLLLGGYMWIRQWKNLMEFRPTLGYDPFFDNISMEMNI